MLRSGASSKSSKQRCVACGVGWLYHVSAVSKEETEALEGKIERVEF